VKPEEWVNLIGYRNANRVFLSYGGRSVHVPKFPHAEHPLAKLIGLDMLNKLSDIYPSELLFVPRMNAVLEDFKQYFGLPKKHKCRRGVFLVGHQKTMFD